MLFKKIKKALKNSVPLNFHEQTSLIGTGRKLNSMLYSLISVKGQIRTTTGQAQLLIARRFKQFRGLVDNCEFNTGDKPVDCSDLQGFWDMVYFQVRMQMKFYTFVAEDFWSLTPTSNLHV